MRPEPSPLLRALHLLSLFAFALAQPLFDVLERSPEFLVAHRADRVDLWLLAAGLSLAVPLLAVAIIEGIWRASPALGRVAHRVAVALLVSGIAVPPIARALPENEGLAVTGGVLAGIAFTIAYGRAASVRSFVTVLSPAIVLFPLLFLGGDSISRVTDTGRIVGAAPAHVENPVPIVFVVFDALPLTSLLDPTGAIDSRRTPHLAALASEGHWFRNATTVATFTDYAVPALLTGRYPRWQQPPTANAYPQNLFTLLGESHTLNVFEPNTRLCPAALCGDGPLASSRGERLLSMASDLAIVVQHRLRPGRLGAALPAVDATWRNFAEEGDVGVSGWRQQVRKHRFEPEWLFQRFLEAVRDSEPPGLHFLHLPVPHSPYRFLPSGHHYRHSPRAFDSLVRVQGQREVVDEWAVTQLRQAHLLQVGYADHLLGKLVDRLEREGLYDRALIVVASDHGVALRPGVPRRELAPGGENAAEILPIPLIIRLPGQRAGRVNDVVVETIDVLPTLLDALGAEAGEDLDGRSLLRDDGPARSARFVTLKSASPEAEARGAGPRRKLRRQRVETAIPGREAVVNDYYARFPLGDGREALFSAGPNSDLLGRGVEELPMNPRTGVSLTLRHVGDYENVDPASGFVPANVAGTLRGPETLGAPLELAVAVDGRIRAVTRTLAPLHGEAPFTALLPDGALRSGSNDLAVFVVRRLEAGRALEATVVESPR